MHNNNMLYICHVQAVRNEVDLNCMAVPVKYRKMNTFYKVHILHHETFTIEKSVKSAKLPASKVSWYTVIYSVY